MEAPDGEIVRRVLSGDTQAYRLLVARHRERFGRFAVRMLGNREDAEEALQDAFVRAYRSLGQCANPDRFDSWFFRILANRCRTKGTRRGRYQATFVSNDAAIALAADPRSESSDNGRGDPDLIVRALSQLDDASREAFLLKYGEGMTYDAMASLTGVGVSALKMRVKRACERLRGLMENEHG